MFTSMKRLVLVTALSLLAVGPTIAAERISTETAAAIVQKSGVADQLPDFAPSMRAGITTNPEIASKLTEAQLGALLGAFESAYAPAKLSADINAALVKDLKPAAAKDALAWLDSPLGTKITELENGATLLANDPEQMAAAQKRLERLPPRRAERYIALMKSTGAAESGAQIVINSSLGMAYGAAATLGGNEPDLADMRKEMEASRPQMVEALGNTYIVMFAAVYQDLPEADLDRYLAFADSASGKAYHKAITDALDVALVNAAKEAGRQIVESSRSQKAKTDA